MYRLLIVDDEPFIVEGLAELFESYDRTPLEVHQAFDGEEALEIAGRLRMDIVLSDIEMPGMNGIELQKELMRQWPRCKMIFLTGYDDFQYIQSSIRGGALDYVLKAEGDGPILAAVEKAILEITEELEYSKLIENARHRLNATQPTLRKEYLLELLQGETSTAALRKSRFAELNIPLAAEGELWVVSGRVDSWREGMNPGDKTLFQYSINNIFEEHLSRSFDIVYLVYPQDRLMWLMQPKSSADPESQATDDEERLETYVQGTLESIQAACRECLRLPCSFVLSSSPCSWDQLPGKINEMSGLFLRGLGMGSEVLLSDRRLVFKNQEQPHGPLRKIGLLGQYLEQKDQEKFNGLYEEIMGTAHIKGSEQTAVTLEIFYQLTAIFISHLNRSGLFAVMSSQIPINRLFSLEQHSSWTEVTLFFRKLADSLFMAKSNENEREEDEVVRLVDQYIHSHLDGDLSLHKLSEVVYLTPYYLSRLYKQKSGVNITDYIAEARVNKANELLGGTQMKIHDIGVRVGYESASYFARFYKKITGLTPQEFRDSLKR